MRLRYILYCCLLALVAHCVPTEAQFPAQCDGDKSCVGNALTIDVTVGKGAQYVDVDTSAQIRSLSSAITFESWIKPVQQPGKRQFVAGLWGPNKDNNDQWVVYVQDNQIVFALSPDGSYKGDTDNTVAAATVADLYTRGWVHIAAVWDGASTQARLYVDGVEAARGSNAQYPLTALKKIESRNLPMQVASCNGLYDDTTRFRTFKGQIDEIRLWSRALTQQEILCQRLQSLAGNEPGLVLYYRCNEQNTSQTLCDATGNGQVGRMRSGAHCDKSDRKVPATYTLAPATIGGSLNCTSDTTFTFTLVDTSFCGNQVNLQIVGPDAGLFTASRTSFTLVQNVPQTFTVRMVASIIGPITADIDIVNANRCGDPVTVPVRLTRRTELDYSKGRLKLDTLFVGCIEKTWSEDTLKICNNTGRPMRIDAATLGGPRMMWRPEDPAQPLPITLANGKCWNVIVRMNTGDSTKTEYDTLRITSDDRCPGSGVIPIEGRSQEVLAILQPDGQHRADSMKFEDVCPGQISDVQLYQYRNLVADSVFIDSIVISNGFYGRRNVYPIGLAPKIAYFPTYIRFRPDRPGPFTGQAVFYAHYRGCTIQKVIELTGRGISVDVVFNGALVGFGNVTIGKFGSQTAGVTNKGRDVRSMSAYLKVGDVFSITANRNFSIQPGQTIQIGLEFRPREPKTYYDTLCIFDNQCFQTICIPVSGTGVFDALTFTPPYLQMDNVIGCQCRTDTIYVKNNLSSPTTYNWSKNDNTGKFAMKLLTPVSPLPPNGSLAFEVTYCPNDLSDDRSDRAFIDITLPSGELYQVLVRANSVAPKLYVTPLTTFGVVEAGWRKRATILVENASSVPIVVNSVPGVPPGYTVISTQPPIPATLNPRDSMFVEVEFAPTAEQAYDGDLTLSSNSPCNLGWRGQITGRGQVVKLGVPVAFINYGLVRPCDCSVREIPLPNNSQYIPISIDSVWVDGAGVPSPNPLVFVWRSKQTGGTTLPYTIDPQKIDTLQVSFCPNIPATQANLLANATIHIKAHTTGWSQEFKTVLSGRRELNFQPSRVLVSFPATRVDTGATPISVDITVPDAFQNPSGDSIIITGITFVPDQRVFSIDPSAPPFPWIIKRGQKFTFKVDFYPRAPKDYLARLYLQTSFPCKGADTTIQVKGTGFAPAFGLQMAFDTAAVGQDTFHLNTCDTLVVPVMINRAIPQDVIDMVFRLGYDTTYLRLVDITSPYTNTVTVADTGDGARARLRDARNAQAGAVAFIRFVVRGGPAAFPITLDEIDFDSDSLVYFKIIAGIDHGWVIIDQPMIAITGVTNFDTVNIKSCADRQVVVRNPGAIPIRFDSLSGLPPGHTVVASSVPYPATLAPGDSITLTVRFCPRVEQAYDSSLRAFSNQPCPIQDSGMLHSFGFAPPFPMRLLLGATPGSGLVNGTIADTVDVPIYVDRDVPQTPLDVNLFISYNRRALEYLGITSKYSTRATGAASSQGVQVSLPHCDSLKAGEIARLRFVVTVPDSVLSKMYLEPQKFTSDSIFWVKLDPPITTGDTASVRVDPRCNISRLNFVGGANKLLTPVPNPTTGRISIDAQMVEDNRTRLALFNSAGIQVLEPLDGSQLLHGGSYRFEFDAGGLPSGDYFIVFEAGTFRATQRVRIVK
ncbi:MAG: choice-of-anchor D domain-containing protein [Bacteroidetes bacterium]|nr:choice-of-anchor D domain-containing protein [Bacteroidota bacterium]